jgi:hypothetical protein
VPLHLGAGSALPLGAGWRGKRTLTANRHAVEVLAFVTAQDEPEELPVQDRESAFNLLAQWTIEERRWNVRRLAPCVPYPRAWQEAVELNLNQMDGAERRVIGEDLQC